MDKARVIFIGLDSAEPALLLSWAREGALPNLARLWEESAWTTPATPPGLGNGAAWPSMFTGVNPGRHGRYYYTQFQPDTYECRIFREDEDFRQPPFWQALSEADLRVAIIDVVRAPLTPHINGIQIADWMTHDRVAQPRSWPTAMIDEIVSRHGEDPVSGNIDRAILHSSAMAIADWRDILIDRIRTKTAMSREIFEREPWDLFMTVYADPHDIGHMFWHMHDAHHLGHDAKWVARYGDPVKEVYVELDRAIGEWVKLAGNHSHLAVFAAPGMGPSYSANGALDELLSRIERLCDGERSGPNLSYSLKQAYQRFVPNSLRGMLPIRQMLKGIAASLGKEEQQPGLSHRKFFPIPHNQNAGAIRFNVKGRESYGLVEPGPQLSALRRRVIEELCRTINQESGKPVVEKIIRTDQQYQGPQAHMLPDLLVIWNRDASIQRLASPSIGKIKVPPSSMRTGDHTPNAVFMVRTMSGSSSGKLAGSSRVEDIAPTITGLLGVKLADVDGTNLDSAPHTDSSLQARQPKTGTTMFPTSLWLCRVRGAYQQDLGKG